MQQARKLNYKDQVRLPKEPLKRPVGSSQPGQKLAKLKLMSILFTCFILSLVVIAQYSFLVIMNYQMSSIHTELASLSVVTHELELEAARLSTAGRIEQIAREELGMVEPEIDQLFIISARQGEGIISGE
jgi:cell division protein FtsL